MVITGFSADIGSCGMNAMSRPSRLRRFWAGMVTRSSPMNASFPLVTAKPGGSNWAIVRPSIDLPAPDSPPAPARGPAAP